MPCHKIQITSLVTTTSGVCGVLCKALCAHLGLTNITLNGIVDVSFYASISAFVEYGVKAGIDHLADYFKTPGK